MLEKEGPEGSGRKNFKRQTRSAILEQKGTKVNSGIINTIKDIPHEQHGSVSVHKTC
jgi:hypothetical protein